MNKINNIVAFTMLCFSLIAISYSQDILFPAQTGTRCQTNQKQNGVCDFVASCKAKLPLPPSLCGFHNNQLIVCCPLEGTNASVEVPTEPLLGLPSSSDVGRPSDNPLLPPDLPATVRPTHLLPARPIDYDDVTSSLPQHDFDDVTTSLPQHDYDDVTTSQPHHDFDGRCGFNYNDADFKNGNKIMKRKRRVVGGVESDVTKWPWMVNLGEEISVETENGTEIEKKFHCGGALIDNQHVLTAAHCFKINLTIVRVATKKATNDLDTNLDQSSALFRIDAKFIHPDYSTSTVYNDLAVVKLDKKVQLGEERKSLPDVICLPRKDYLSPQLSKFITIAGWGRTMYRGDISTKLRVLKAFEIVPKSICESSYLLIDGCAKCRLRRGVVESMFCAGEPVNGDRSACQGDSGGPGMIFDEARQKWIVAGVIVGGNGCGIPEFPTLLTNVHHFIPWIRNITRLRL